MKNYEVTFKSLRTGTTYKVTIGGGTGTAVALKGAASPLMTSEDTSDDMFEPIRTTTGYLRIEDDGYAADGVTAFDWKDMIPETDLSRPVAVTADGATVWQGYLQAQDFGNTLYGNPQARDYPVMCPLAALSASMVDTTERQMRNFAYLMLQAFNSLPGIDIDRFVIQGGAQAREWLLKLVDWQGMLDVGSEGVTARYSNYEALSSMCQFWGWTCRYKGSTVYLTCVDDDDVTGWLTLTYSQLATLAGGESAGTVTADGYDSVVVDGGFASVDNEERLARGYSDITVESDAKEPNEDILEIFPSSVESEMVASGGSLEQYDNGFVAYVSTDTTSFSTPALSGRCENGGATFNMMHCRRRTGDASWFQDVGTVAAIRVKQSYNGSALAMLDVGFEHSYHDTTIANGGFDYGGIYIYGEVYVKGTRYEDANGDGTGKHHIILRVGIGKTRSTAVFTTYRVRVGGTAGVSNELLNINTNNNTSMGRLFIDVMGSDDMPEFSGVRQFELVNLRAQFVRRTYSYMMDKSDRADTREYQSRNDNNVKEDNDVYLNFASDNEMVFGFGVVVNPVDGTQLGKQTYGSTEEWAEQHLADRMAHYWSTSKRVLEVDLLARDIAPTDIVTIDGGQFYPVSIRQEWRDDIIRVMMMDIE